MLLFAGASNQSHASCWEDNDRRARLLEDEARDAQRRLGGWGGGGGDAAGWPARGLRAWTDLPTQCAGGASEQQAATASVRRTRRVLRSSAPSPLTSFELLYEKHNKQLQW